MPATLRTPGEGSSVAEGALAPGVGQLPGGRTLLRSLAHHSVALRDQRRAEGRSHRTERADPSSEPESVHGAGFRELMPDVPDIAVKSLPSISPEETHDVRARAWGFVFQCWHAKKGDPHDLTNGSTAEVTKNGPRKTEREKT